MADRHRDDSVSEIASGLRELRGPCPDAEDLIGYARGELDAARRQAVEAHLRLCPTCQDLAELAGADPELDADLDEVTWRRAERGLDAREAPWRPGTTASARSYRWLGLAAALLVAAVGAGIWLTGPVPEPPAGPGVTRGLGLQAVAPTGIVEALAEFRWQAPPVEVRYRVEVVGAGGEIWRGETDDVGLEAPPELGEVLEAGETYRWRVVGLGTDGAMVLESAWTEFGFASPALDAEVRPEP